MQDPRMAIRDLVPSAVRPIVKRTYLGVTGIVREPYRRYVKTRALLLQRRHGRHRRLEIGPGPQRLDGFETLNVVPGSNVDYVWNASTRLPFASGTFELIYASHVLEHIPWYQTDTVLAEWVRVLAPSGRIEIWVPDGVKICKAFIDAELQSARDFESDGWYRFNEAKDSCRWASGRLFSYGDGLGTRGHENWHLAVFSFRYLEHALRRAGCGNVEALNPDQVRGHDHGWINLGIAGTKT
jgi:SAM-dependent methyltransferase